MVLDKIKNSQKLTQILLNFIDVLRINIMVVDPKGKPVLVPKANGYGFHGATQWGLYQHLGKPEFFSNFQKEGHYLKSIDAFGFQSFALPVALKGLDPCAYLIVGPVILNKQMEGSAYQAIAQDMDLNYAEFMECLAEIRVVSFNSLKSILDLLSELSQYSLRMKNTEIELPAAEISPKPMAQSIFSNLLELSMAITQAECGSIMLLNNLTNELNILIYKGIDLQKVQNIPVKLGQGIAGLAAQKKESFVINEGQPNNRIRHLLKKPELKCALVMPIMKNNNDVLGVMNISTHQVNSRLATHSQQMLKNLVEITSGTFKNFK